MSARLLLAALWLFHWLPLAVQAAFGNGLGRLGWHLVRSRRRIALRNLELCFPELVGRRARRGWRASTSAGSAAACSSAACSGTRRRRGCAA